MHARIENGQVAEYPIINLRQHLPDCSLPADLSNDAALPEGYVYVRASNPPQYNPTTQTIEPAGPVFAEDHWELGYTVRDLTAGELAQRAEQAAQATAQARLQAYRDEADPLFFKAQRGEATMDDWLAKVAEIKARYPGA